MRIFGKFIGIDYSGAKRAIDPAPGLRVFVSSHSDNAVQIRNPESGYLHWTRTALAHWLVETLSQSPVPCLVGIDHAFSFPEEYFALHNIARDWDSFLDDFVEYWPSDSSDLTVADLLARNRANPTGRIGSARWRRPTERLSKGAKSVFHFSVPGSVASSTHAGLPWLKFLRTHPQLSGKLHFWPFDGWMPKVDQHLIAEVYPSLWSNEFLQKEKTRDEHDAWTVCHKLASIFGNEAGQNLFHPDHWKNIHLSEAERKSAHYEGWILGLQ